MRKQLPYLAFLLLGACNSNNSSYQDSIDDYRNQYKMGFILDERAPLTKDDTAYLKFFPVDEQYKVIADFKLTPDAEPFDIPTVSGKTKKYRQYGIASFSINDTTVELQVYQSLKLIQQQEYKNHLFLPFTDATTYTTTYGGGRYLDLSKTDIINNKVELDFNKCYNPWCAYADGYSCPIPPKENRLPVAILAGEKNFGKEVVHE